MCLAKPGPRCDGHAIASVFEAATAFSAARKNKERVLDKAMAGNATDAEWVEASGGTIKAALRLETAVGSFKTTAAYYGLTKRASQDCAKTGDDQGAARWKEESEQTKARLIASVEAYNATAEELGRPKTTPERFLKSNTEILQYSNGVVAREDMQVVTEALGLPSSVGASRPLLLRPSPRPALQPEHEPVSHPRPAHLRLRAAHPDDPQYAAALPQWRSSGTDRSEMVYKDVVVGEVRKRLDHDDKPVWEARLKVPVDGTDNEPYDNHDSLHEDSWSPTQERARAYAQKAVGAYVIKHQANRSISGDPKGLHLVGPGRHAGHDFVHETLKSGDLPIAQVRVDFYPNSSIPSGTTVQDHRIAGAVQGKREEPQSLQQVVAEWDASLNLLQHG